MWLSDDPVLDRPPYTMSSCGGQTATSLDLRAVPALAASWRAAGTGRVDLAEVGNRAGVRVLLSDLGPSMWGVTLAADSVVINRCLGALERRFALAHELAHVLRLRAGRCLPEPAWREERFADAFARELLLPRAVVRATASVSGAGGVDDLAREYAVDRGTVLLQAAAVGLAPAVQTTDEGRAVLCADCGHRPHAPGCACRAARAALKDASRGGPDAARLNQAPGWETTCW